MNKRRGNQGKRKRTIDSSSSSGSGEEDNDGRREAARNTGLDSPPEDDDISVTSDEEDEDDLEDHWLLIHGPSTKEEGCDLLTQSDLHFDIVDAKYNPLTRCFGVPIENRGRLEEYAKVLAAILTGGLRVSTGRYVSPNDTQSISLTCHDGASPDVSDDEFKRVVNHKYDVSLKLDDFRIIYTSARCWRVLLTDKKLTERLVESGNIALSGEQLQVQRWRNDLDAPDFPVYINNIAHDAHRKNLRKYFARKCNDDGMTIYWGQGGWAVCRFTTEKARQVALALNGRKRFKGVPIAVSLPKSPEERDESNRKRDEARKQREAKKAEARNRAAEADKRKKRDEQRSQHNTPKRNFTPRWGTGADTTSSPAPPPYTPTTQTGPPAGSSQTAAPDQEP